MTESLIDELARDALLRSPSIIYPVFPKRPKWYRWLLYKLYRITDSSVFVSGWECAGKVYDKHTPLQDITADAKKRNPPRTIIWEKYTPLRTVEEHAAISTDDPSPGAGVHDGLASPERFEGGEK